MKKATSLMIIAAMVVSGCSAEYKANMHARETIELYRSQGRTAAMRTVMQAVGMIIRPIEVQYKYEQAALVGQPSPLGQDDVYQSDLLTAMRDLMRWHGMAELARARALAVQYLAPIVQAIYQDGAADFGTPMTTNELVARMAGNLPILATVAGMYGLGTAAARYAGDRITAQLESGANLNVGGIQVGGHWVPGADNAISAQSSSYSVRGNPAPGGVNEIELPPPAPDPLDEFGGEPR